VAGRQEFAHRPARRGLGAGEGRALGCRSSDATCTCVHNGDVGQVVRGGRVGARPGQRSGCTGCGPVPL